MNKRSNAQENLHRQSMKFTRWVGTPVSVIIHTIFFIGIFGLEIFGLTLDQILLILTTLVSLEAIYLAIFIQMTVNQSFTSLEEVGADIEEIQDEVKDLGEDVEEISEDLDKIQESDQEDDKEDADTRMTLEKIEGGLQKLLIDIEHLKNNSKKP